MESNCILYSASRAVSSCLAPLVGRRAILEHSANVAQTIVLIFVFALTAAGQHTNKTHSGDLSSAATRCHAIFASLDGKDYEWFEALPVTRATELRESIETCVRDEYDEIPKWDLVLAAVDTGWLQELIDRQNGTPVATCSPVPDTSDSDDPVIVTGKVRVFPIDIGENFSFWLGSEKKNCSATSTKEISCGIEDFEAVLISQKGREYLAGCKFDGYETCADLSTGLYSVIVHGRTLTFVDSGLSVINKNTGKRISSITPVLSVFVRVK